MFCGSCMRDNTLVAALHRAGCDVQLAPTYTPIRTDDENVSIDRVFYGGINVYLQQLFPWLGRLPKFLDSWLDHPRLISYLASRGMETDAAQLGAMTVSMLKGTAGFQRKEVRRLVRWLAEEARPDVVDVTNILISGFAPELKSRWNGRLVVTLQGDDLFFDGLVEPYRSQALAEVRRLLPSIDAFVTFNAYYADYMADYLGVDRGRIHLAPLGMRLRDVPPRPQAAADRPPTIGYFARHCPAKGLHVLVDAFVDLAARPGMEQVRLRSAGWLGDGDRAYFNEQLAKLQAAGVGERYEYAGSPGDRAGKFDFLHGLDLFCVPTTYREPKGLFVLEALAAGLPVVAPAHGGFPELLAGDVGRLVPPGDPVALADALEDLLGDAEARSRLAAAGPDHVRTHHSDDAMAAATLEIYRRVLAG